MNGDIPLRNGVHKELEEAADSIIFEHLAAVTRHADKSDVLTPWKWQDRTRREVFVPAGSPDGSLRRGTFSRVWNPGPGQSHLNSVAGVAPPRRRVGATSFDDD